MHSRCVVGGCNNLPDTENSVILHTISFDDDDRPLALKRRKRWEDFLKLKQARWQHTKNSAICSVHYKPDDFEFLQVYQGRGNRCSLGFCKFKLTVYPSLTAIRTVNHHPQKKEGEINSFDAHRKEIYSMVESLMRYFFVIDDSRGNGCNLFKYNLQVMSTSKFPRLSTACWNLYTGELCSFKRYNSQTFIFYCFCHYSFAFLSSSCLAVHSCKGLVSKELFLLELLVVAWRACPCSLRILLEFHFRNEVDLNFISAS